MNLSVMLSEVSIMGMILFEGRKSVQQTWGLKEMSQWIEELTRWSGKYELGKEAQCTEKMSSREKRGVFSVSHILCHPIPHTVNVISLEGYQIKKCVCDVYV